MNGVSEELNNCLRGLCLWLPRLLCMYAFMDGTITPPKGCIKGAKNMDEMDVFLI